MRRRFHSRLATPRGGVLAASLIAVLLSAAIYAAEQAKPQDNPDVALIRAAIDSYVAAYNRGDAKAVAACWSDTGEWVSPSGDRFQGKQAIQREMEDMFADNKGVKIEVIDPLVRLISSDAAVEEGTVKVTSPSGPPSESTYMAVHSKKNGQWKLESVRETSVPEPNAHDELTQLQWMVGEWQDESPGVVVQHSLRWSDDGHYLLGNFVVQWKDKPAMKGDVRIGWDPLSKQIKSWIFDTEGGYAEGLWTRAGDGWVVKMNGVRPDGSVASSTNTYEPLRRDQYQYSSLDRIVGGQQEPDQSTRIVRRPPEPGKR
jgi:uncharacterized protein (TIGR02246 family)